MAAGLWGQTLGASAELVWYNDASTPILDGAGVPLAASLNDPAAAAFLQLIYAGPNGIRDPAAFEPGSDGTTGDDVVVAIGFCGKGTDGFLDSPIGGVMQVVQSLDRTVFAPVVGDAFFVRAWTQPAADDLAGTVSADPSVRFGDSASYIYGDQPAGDALHFGAEGGRAGWVADTAPARLDVRMTVSRDGGCPGEDGVLAVNGAEVTYCMLISNGGDVDLGDVILEDPVLGLVTNLGTVAGGQIVTVSVTAVVSGDLTNSVSATVLDSYSNIVAQDADDAVVTAIDPSLSLSKTASLDGSCPGVEQVWGTNGAAVAYCFVVTNEGDVALSDVTLSDLDISPPVTTNLGALAAGTAVTVSVDRVVSGSLTNLASVTGNDPNGDPVSDADAAVVLRYLPVADLRLHKSVAPSPNFAGSNVTYTLTVTNLGPDVATGVVVSDTLPAGHPFISAASTAGECLATGQTVSCQLGSMTSGAVETISIEASSLLPVGGLTITGEGALQNANFEQGSNGLAVAIAPQATYHWQDFSSQGASSTYSSDEAQSGSISILHVVAEGELSAGADRFAQVGQEAWIDNPAGHHVWVDLSSSFLGDLSQQNNGHAPAPYLEIAFFDAQTNLLLEVNHLDTEPSLEGLTVSTWTNLQLTAQGPPQTAGLRLGAGISQNGSLLACSGMWDNVSAVVSLAPSYTNQADVLADLPDPNPLDNMAEAVTTVMTPVDWDGDSMPDWWEIDQFGDIVSGVATNDSDGDGVADLDEYIADTDPTQESSFFCIMTAELEGGNAVLVFDTSPARLYRPERTENLSLPWTPFIEAFAGHGGPVAVTDPLPVTNGYYRVRITLTDP